MEAKEKNDVLQQDDLIPLEDTSTPVHSSEDTEAIEQIEDKPRKRLLDRMFGKIEAGSVRGSIFTLSILSLGSGCLALPQKVGQMSIAVCTVDIILAGLAGYWTLMLLAISADKYKIGNYSQLAGRLHGKWLSLLLDITMLVYIFGIMILYQVIIYKLVGGVVNELGGYGYKSLDSFLKESFWKENIYKFPIMYGFVLVIILPLCLLKDISKMRFSSIFGMFSLLSLVLVIIIQCPWYVADYLANVYKPDDPSTHLNFWDISKGFTEKLYFFKGTATLFYAYSCHVGAFPIYRALKNNNLRRVNKVFARSILVDGCFYFVVAVTGYLTAPFNTPDLIIERPKLFDNDIIMTIGRIAFIFTVIMKIPANYNSFRISFIELIGKDSKNFSNQLNFLITIPIVCFSTLIAALYNSITDYISLMGSFCAVIVAFVVPGLIYVKGNDYHITHWKNLVTMILVSIFALIGLTSGIFTIIGMIH